MIVPHGIDGGRVVACGRLVDDIIVYERGIVEHLDGCCRGYDTVGDGGSEQTGREHYHHGAELFAFMTEVSAYHLVDEGIGRTEPVGYQRVDALKVGGKCSAYGMMSVITECKFTKYSVKSPNL